MIRVAIRGYNGRAQVFEDLLDADQTDPVLCVASLLIAVACLCESIRSTRMLRKLDLWERSDDVLLYSIHHEEP